MGDHEDLFCPKCGANIGLGLSECPLCGYSDDPDDLEEDEE